MSSESPTQPASVPKILIVDDHVENLAALEATLESTKVSCVRAQSAEEALHRTLDHDFASILLDVQMPGIDGFETAKLLRGSQRTSHIPIIFLTAIHKDFSFALRGYSAGAVDYLSKPVDPEVLTSKVEVFAELHLKSKVIQEQANHLVRLNAALRDEIDEKNRIAEELARSNEELERFAYVCCHDLQEPLRKTALLCDMLEEDHGDQLGEQGRKRISQIIGGANRMRTLVNDVLALARVGGRNLELEAVSCAEVLDVVREDLDDAIVAAKATITAGELPVVHAERSQLTQLFGNLLANAIKFHGTRRPRVHVEARRDGAFWEMSVSDNGIGIEEEHRARIFQIFEHLHGSDEYEGTGIGLAICKRIVEHHGGRLWVDSRPGEGSVFRFTLPAAARAEADRAPPGADREAPDSARDSENDEVQSGR